MSSAQTTIEPLAGEVEALCRWPQLRYVRQQAPDVLLTAKAQRWEPAELLPVLLQAEVEGRERSTTENRRRQARFPAGKTFDTWEAKRSSIPSATQQALRTLEWVGRHENMVVCGPSGTGKSHLCEALGQHAVDAGLRVAWFGTEDLGTRVRRHRIDDSIAKAFTPLLRADLVTSTTSACCRCRPMPPRASIASSTPPTSAAASPSARTSTRAASTS